MWSTPPAISPGPFTMVSRGSIPISGPMSPPAYVQPTHNHFGGSSHLNQTPSGTVIYAPQESAPTTTNLSHFSYHRNPDGTIVNTSNGTVPISLSRAVTVRNLNIKVTYMMVRNHFASVGPVELVDLKSSHGTNYKKRTAVVTYRSPTHARHAVERFNQTDWHGRHILVEVRKDDDTGEEEAASEKERKVGETVKQLPDEEVKAKNPLSEGPLIANGSDEEWMEAVSVLDIKPKNE